MENNETTKTFEEKVEKMTLQGYYEKLPRMEAPKTVFINKIMAKTGKSYITVVNWVKGKCKPDSEEDMKVLSELTGIPVEELW